MLRKITLCILIFIFFSCSTGSHRKPAYEGFDCSRLIVFISELIPEKQNITDDQLSAILTAKLNQRASVILACYVSININRSKVSSSNDLILNNTINETLSHGKIIRYSFNERGYCEAWGEYDIEGFLKIIDGINK